MRNRVRDKIFIGFVEDNKDPNHLGRCKIRIHTVFDNIPTEDLPWASPFKDLNGNEFNAPEIGKVVSVIFNNDNIYKPEFIYAEHYNINLENKLKALSNDDYTSFKAIQFDQSTQIYRSKSEGLKIDHEYTNINLDSNGNINLNIRDNNSKINIGSKDAAQAALLGTAFLNWMDKVIIALQSNAAFQANGSPVTVMPSFQQLLQEYQSSKDPKFLSKHIWLANNDEILEQSRDYINQEGDSWTSTAESNNLSKKDTTPYTPIAREDTGRPMQKNNSVPSDTFENTISSEASGTYSTVSLSGYKNGQIPIEQMKKNHYLDRNISGDAIYLMSVASDSLDAMITAFNSAKFEGKQQIVFTDGYRSLERQQALYNKYGPGRAAKPGTSNHGWGIAVDMYWGVKTSMFKDSSKRSSGYKHPNYKWFFENSWRYGWVNPDKLRDDSGTDEWWHWEYHGTINSKPVVSANSYKGNFTEQDIINIKNSGGTFV